MNENFPKVSIITVNYNSTQVTVELLLSLQQITYPNWEVIVVDNGSKTPCKELKTDFPWIIYIETGKNLGFAGGNNVGIKRSTGDYIFLLNNDTEVDKYFIEPLIERFKQNNKIGIVCPKILYFFQPNIIQFAGFKPISPITGRGFSIGYQEKDNGQYDTACISSRAHGAAMMFSREAMNNVGLMAEIYFLYYEEMDYSERFKRAVYEIWYEPASKIWHKESISTGKDSALKAYYYGRNRLLYLRRNTSFKYKFLMYPYLCFIAVPKNKIDYLRKGQFKQLLAFGLGFLWNVVHSSKDPNDKK